MLPASRARPHSPAVQAYLIFDLDGTLVDSLRGIADTLNRTLTAHGLPGHSDANVRGFIGNGLRNLVTRAAPAGADPSLIDSLLAFYQKDYDLSWQYGSLPYPGVPAMLDALQHDKFKMAVLSNKTHDFTTKMVRGIFPAVDFTQVLGQRDGQPHKPDPTGALQLAAVMGAAPENCIVIGDSTMDIETAANAGMRSIAVTWGYHDRHRLEAAGPGHIIDHPHELRPLLAS
jgi:phosphoglycolate phosphatase